MPRSGVDYATDQITVYRYCPYNCAYCYVWRSKLFSSRVQRGKYDPVEEARKYLNKRNRVIVVSFVSDPYPPEEADKRITRRVLEVLSGNPCNRVMVLTKNPGLALRDLDVMKKGNIWLGTTIITFFRPFYRKLEPYAPSPLERVKALVEAHKEGVRTWISIEPIIPFITYPEEIVRLTLVLGVDYYVLGAYNYYNRITLPTIEYREETKYVKKNVEINLSSLTRDILKVWYVIHVSKAIELLESYGRKYFIKKELQAFLEE